MPRETTNANELLLRSVEADRIHAAYLISGAGDEPAAAAVDFARSLVCSGSSPKPCGECAGCRRSGADSEPAKIDGTGKRGPLYRHIGDHPDLLWTERDSASTRVRIAQVRAIQHALRLRANEGGRRVAVIADAEWLNAEAQNALLHLLEEPPNLTTIVLVAASATGLLATIRSRCQRVRFTEHHTLDLRSAASNPELAEIAQRLDDIQTANLPQLLDWASEFRGNRAAAAEKVELLLAGGSEWLRERAIAKATEAEGGLPSTLDAFKTLSRCRRDLVQRNANPQMIAERALFAVRRSVS
jgi:DNA polymerase III delta prime subunit